ncbi:hypothetical protein GWI33_018506 [Rhynchophorus ferrugineus]|uniref:Uncharacterized protein n=1 Tax=Rhynchophorus ferrugineus TaxID=354439 RepID=A0A834HXP8_RHYFE|nr:hypothetical protein GWI33_018506 [Rhynchophorus ferrugineus]
MQIVETISQSTDIFGSLRLDGELLEIKPAEKSKPCFYKWQKNSTRYKASGFGSSSGNTTRQKYHNSSCNRPRHKVAVTAWPTSKSTSRITDDTSDPSGEKRQRPQKSFDKLFTPFPIRKRDKQPHRTTDKVAPYHRRVIFKPSRLFLSPQSYRRPFFFYYVNIYAPVTVRCENNANPSHFPTFGQVVFRIRRRRTR